MAENMFAAAENVTQLFDALWYHGCDATLIEGLQAAREGREWDGSVVQKHRERAIVDAHKRYQELTADA